MFFFYLYDPCFLWTNAKSTALTGWQSGFHGGCSFVKYEHFKLDMHANNSTIIITCVVHDEGTSYLILRCVGQGRGECRVYPFGGPREVPGRSRMGDGRFSLFTLDLCPAMLNPAAFLPSQGHHLHFSPGSRVMEWRTLGSQWLIRG